MSDERSRWLKPDSLAERRLTELLEAGRDERPSAARRLALSERLAAFWQRPGADGDGGGNGSIGSDAVAAGSGTASPGVLLTAAAGLLIVGLAAWWSWQPTLEPGARPTSAVRAPCSECVARARRELAPAHTSVPTSRPAAAAASERDAGAAGGVLPRAAHALVSARPNLALELSLLDAAQRALAVEPARALALTVRHARRFPDSQLKQERELIAIEALVRLGDRSRALARALRFVRDYQGSSHEPRVRELLELPAAAATPSARDAG